MIDAIISFIRDYYKTNEVIPLHSPVFLGNEYIYLKKCIESSYVSTIGEFVNELEKKFSHYTLSPSAVAVVNGTAGLHLSLKIAGVLPGEYVITQALTFVATANAISYCGATPIFIDVDRKRLSLSPVSMESWLEENAYFDEDGMSRLIKDNKIIRACVPMHTFGHPAQIDNLLKVCDKWNIRIIEDAAEALGSFYKDKHVGTFGDMGVISLNGNKIITAGGGGVILSNKNNGVRAKHLSTTAKSNDSNEFYHDEIGYNYRMPNLNAALALAQIECINLFLRKKRELASEYKELFRSSEYEFVDEPENCKSNFWLNTIICNDEKDRDQFIKQTNKKGIITRPSWKVMNKLPMYSACLSDELENTRFLDKRIVNMPSSVVIES